MARVPVLATLLVASCDPAVDQKGETGLLYYDAGLGKDGWSADGQRFSDVDLTDAHRADVEADDIEFADGFSADRESPDRTILDRYSPDGYAPDGYSPDGSAPDGYSPDGSLPDRYSPDGYSPDGISPDGSEPDGYSPDGSLPDGYSPDGYSPDRYSPDGYSADGYSADGWAPDSWAPDTWAPDTWVDDGWTAPDSGFEPGPTSLQIAQARQAFDGVLVPPLAIDNAIVTYVRPLLSDVTPGFYIQAERPGPGIFIAVDPVTLSPEPQVGDVVSLLASGKGQFFESPYIENLASYSRISTGYDVELLRQDVSGSADLVDAVGDYDGELISVECTITGSFSLAGVAYQVAPIATDVVVGDPDLLIRVPYAVREALHLQQSSSLTLSGVLTRYGTQAQASAWRQEDILVQPKVVRAGPASSTEVRVLFSTDIHPASAANEYFSMDPFVSVHSASVDGPWITLQTDALALGVTYTLTASTSITSTQGIDLDPNANTAQVLLQNIQLVINEVEYDQIGVDSEEFVEIKNTGAALDLTLAGVELVMYNGNPDHPAPYRRVDLGLGGQLASGGYLVFASPAVAVSSAANKVLFTNSEGEIKNSNNVENGEPGGDGLALYNIFTRSLVDALSYEGEITAVFDGESHNLVEGQATLVEDDNSSTSLSLCRQPDGADSDNAIADWQACYSLTPGWGNF